jgi:polyhydroxyalkanoate synthase
MEASNEKAAFEYVQQLASQFNAAARDIILKQMSESSDSEMSLFDPSRIAEMFTGELEVDTSKLISEQMNFMEKQMMLWQGMAGSFLGDESKPLITEEKTDKRFKDKEWSENPAFSYLKQVYLLQSQMLENMMDAITFPDEKSESQAKFYTRQYINSVSPTNYVMTNPEVCREVLRTEGKNLVKGTENFLRDLEQSPLEALKITQTNEDAFELGKDLAYTPGKVIYQNDLIQLIHYAPETEEVYGVPLLFTPPIINKYYVLDLDEKKSMVRWLVKKGFSVFMISWVNPDSDLAEKDFSDYMKEGPLQAIKIVKKVTRAKKVNVVGFCIGGTLLASAAAYLRSKGDESINSLTFLTTLLDFTEQGEIGNYLSEYSLPLIEDAADSKGYFDGRVLSLSFSLLRENNLFWSYFINNYLKGEDPAAFDILYWNSDSTNLAAACFKEYLRMTYWENKLREPHKVELDGVKIDLSDVDMPCYFLAGAADHIVLWNGAYESAKLVGGDSRFVLTGSGHIAGVLNSPDQAKYPYWSNSDWPETALEWQEGANQTDASWWLDWHDWLAPQSGNMKKACPNSTMIPA